MPKGKARVVIGRPVEDVFAYMNDVSREHEWQPQLREAEQTPSGPPGVGTRRRYVSEFMGRRVENTYVIRTFEPNELLVLETTPESSLSAKTEVRWTPIGSGTEVTMSIEGSPKGALKLLPRRVLEATFEKEVERTLSHLKEVLER
jgi:uncharacterized protein YndB with AHSA1/START domain